MFSAMSHESRICRRVLHTLSSSSVRLDVLIDEYPVSDGHVILNTRHSIALRQWAFQQGQMRLDALDAEAITLGKIVFLPANVPFYVRGGGISERLVRLEFDDDRFPLISKAVNSISSREMASLVSIQNGSIARLLQALALEAEAPGVASDLIFEGYSAVLAAELVRHIDARERIKSTGVAHARNLDLEKAANYIRAHLQRRISVNEIAHLYGLSERHCLRLFREESGENIHSFIEGVRIDHAKNLLASSDMAIKRIAHRLGYADHASFSIAFRRRMGRSPLEFRLMSAHS